MNIAICDDDDVFMNYLKENITEMLETESSIKMYNSPLNILNDIEETGRSVDILFMDIDLGEYNGIELAKQIQFHFPQIKIIFVTGYLKYAEDIFNIKPTYFLVKPVNGAKLRLALETVKQAIDEDKHKTLALSWKGGIINVRVGSIKYIESSKRVISIYQDDRQWQIYGRLDDLQLQLPDNFVRCHKSYLVNMDKIRCMDGQKLTLYTGKDIPISQSKYSDTKKKFLKYLGDSI